MLHVKSNVKYNSESVFRLFVLFLEPQTGSPSIHKLSTPDHPSVRKQRAKIYMNLLSGAEIKFSLSVLERIRTTEAFFTEDRILSGHYKLSLTERCPYRVNRLYC